MMIFRRISILMILIASTLSAQKSQYYTLEDCLNIAESSNFSIQLSKSEAIANKADLRNAFGQYLPYMSYNMGYSRKLNPDGGYTVNVGGQIIPVNAESPNSFNMSATASLNLFDGFYREGNFKRADNTYEASKLNISQIKQDVLFQIYSSYINVVRNYQIVYIRKKNLDLGKSDYDRIKAQYDAGVIPVAAVYSQEAEIANREVEVITAENNLNSSKAEIMTSMGLMPDLNAEFSQESIPQDITETDINTFRKQIGSLDYALQRALSNRSDIKASEYKVNAAEGNMQVSKSGYMPTVSASGGWNWSHTEFDQFKENGRSYVGLNLSVPLFQNFSVDRNVQQAKLNLLQQQVFQKQAEQQVRTEVQKAYLNLESAEKSLSASKRAVKAAEQNYKSTQERLNVGSANITDLQTANTQFVTAQINYMNAVYSYIAAQKQILYSVGELK